MKKYRPVKLWIVLLTIILAGVACMIFLGEHGHNLTPGILCGLLSLFLIHSTTFFIQFQKDRVIIKYTHDSNIKLGITFAFKPRVILYKNITQLYINIDKKEIYILQNDGENVQYSLAYFFPNKKIIERFMNIEGVEKQIMVRE